MIKPLAPVFSWKKQHALLCFPTHFKLSTSMSRPHCLVCALCSWSYAISITTGCWEGTRCVRDTNWEGQWSQQDDRRKSHIQMRDLATCPFTAKLGLPVEEKALTGTRIITQSGQGINTCYSICLWRLCALHFKEFSELLPASFYAATTSEASKIFFKFNISSNRHFAFCWGDLTFSVS